MRNRAAVGMCMTTLLCHLLTKDLHPLLHPALCIFRSRTPTPTWLYAYIGQGQPARVTSPAVAISLCCVQTKGENILDDLAINLNNILDDHTICNILYNLAI